MLLLPHPQVRDLHHRRPQLCLLHRGHHLVPKHLVPGHWRYPGRGHHLQPGHLRVLHLRGHGPRLHPPRGRRHQTSALPDPALALRQHSGTHHGHDPDRVHNSFRHNQVQAVLQRVRDHLVSDGIPRRGHPLLLDGRVHIQEESPHGSQVQSSPITQPNRPGSKLQLSGPQVHAQCPAPRLLRDRHKLVEAAPSDQSEAVFRDLNQSEASVLS